MELSSWTGLIRDVALVLAGCIGGVWALWKWRYEERERKRLQVVSVESYLETSLVPLTEKRSVLSITSVWNNVSHRHIFVDTQNSHVRIYEVPTNKNVQYLNITSQCQPMAKGHTLRDRRRYVLEAKSVNRLTAQFVVDRGKVYAIRWKLYRDMGQGERNYAWTKEVIVST